MQPTGGVSLRLSSSPKIQHVFRMSSAWGQRHRRTIWRVRVISGKPEIASTLAREPRTALLAEFPDASADTGVTAAAEHRVRQLPTRTPQSLADFFNGIGQKLAYGMSAACVATREAS